MNFNIFRIKNNRGTRVNSLPSYLSCKRKQVGYVRLSYRRCSFPDGQGHDIDMPHKEPPPQDRWKCHRSSKWSDGKLGIEIWNFNRTLKGSNNVKRNINGDWEGRGSKNSFFPSVLSPIKTVTLNSEFSFRWSIKRPTSVIRKTDIFSSDQWNLVPDNELETLDHFLIWFLTIILSRSKYKVS